MGLRAAAFGLGILLLWNTTPAEGFGSAPASAGRSAGDRKVIEVEGVEFAFRWIPKGRDRLGDRPDDPCARGTKQHKFKLRSGLWMSETEVTQSQWKAVKSPAFIRDCGSCPAESVSWVQTQEFIAGLNEHLDGLVARLPSSDEWEYAARAGSDGPYSVPCSGYPGKYCAPRGRLPEGVIEFLPDPYPGGYPPCADDVGWHEGNSREAQPVARKKPNAWGLFDMHGNVAEWCGNRPGSEKYPLRGGSHQDSFREMRSAAIGGEYAVARVVGVGFRIVLEDVSVGE